MNDDWDCVCLQCFGKENAVLQSQAVEFQFTQNCWYDSNSLEFSLIFLSLLSSFICALCRTSCIYPSSFHKQCLVYMFHLPLYFLHAVAYYECDCTVLPMRKYTPTCTTPTVTLLIHPVRQTLTLQGVE